MYMTITIWIEKKHLEDFKKFYDAVNQEKIIEKEDVPSVEFKTYAPDSSYLQVNLLYEIYQIMNELLNNKNQTKTE